MKRMPITGLLTGFCLAATLVNLPQAYATIPNMPMNATNTNPTIAQRNKQQIITLYEQVFNRKQLQLLPDFIDETYVAVNGQQGVAEFAQTVNTLQQAFTNAHWTIEYIMADDEKVMIRQLFEGIHTGVFQGVMPTGRTVAVYGTAVYTFKQGKVVKADVLTDRFTFLQQLEVLPAGGVTAAKQPSENSIYFIDKFVVPAAGKEEFLQRVAINRTFISGLPGFVNDAAYESMDDTGNLTFITVAAWRDAAAVEAAKKSVQAKYQQEGFDMPGMIKRLGITMERGMYTQVRQ